MVGIPRPGNTSRNGAAETRRSATDDGPVLPGGRPGATGSPPRPSGGPPGTSGGPPGRAAAVGADRMLLASLALAGSIILGCALDLGGLGVQAIVCWLAIAV